MKMQPIENSSFLLQAGYSPIKQQLRLVLARGTTEYNFYNVPQDVYTKLLAAPSHGSYYNQNIRGKFAA